jgi:5-methylcytosine-specific restriction endonuclease McrA
MKKKVVKKRTSKVVKTRNAGTMTESQYFSKIRSMLRNGFRYWKPMQLALEAASRPSQSLNKRIKKEYQCASCKKWFKREDVHIDHIEEAGSLKNYDDIVPFIQRLTKEEVSAYQILCKNPCHLNKTNKERLRKKSLND